MKDVDRLVAAYDDAAGVTAAFNRNVLRVINRELAADFDPDAFTHLARFDPEAEWIEMRLRAEGARTVRLRDLDLTVQFSDGEEMRTEISTKFRQRRRRARVGRGRPRTGRVVDGSRGGLRSLTLLRRAVIGFAHQEVRHSVGWCGSGTTVSPSGSSSTSHRSPSTSTERWPPINGTPRSASRPIHSGSSGARCTRRVAHVGIEPEHRPQEQQR